jgi:hypothetical protein
LTQKLKENKILKTGPESKKEKNSNFVFFAEKGKDFAEADES